MLNLGVQKYISTKHSKYNKNTFNTVEQTRIQKLGALIYNPTT